MAYGSSLRRRQRTAEDVFLDEMSVFADAGDVSSLIKDYERGTGQPIQSARLEAILRRGYRTESELLFARMEKMPLSRAQQAVHSEACRYAWLARGEEGEFKPPVFGVP